MDLWQHLAVLLLGALSLIVSSASAKDDRRSCLLCNNESPTTCNMFDTPVQCLNHDDVCQWSIKTDALGKVKVDKGCMSKPECDEKHSNNGAHCDEDDSDDNDEDDEAARDSSCTWCCEDRNNCNIANRPTRPTTGTATASTTTTPAPPPSSSTTTTTTAAPTTTTTPTPPATTTTTTPSPPPSTTTTTTPTTTTTTTTTPTTTTTSSTCDLVEYGKCVDLLQQLTLTAAAHPDQLFNNFCSYLDRYLECIAVVEGCEVCSIDRHLNTTLLQLLFTGMSKFCNLQCNFHVGFTCIHEYYRRSIIAISTELDCILIGKIEAEHKLCIAHAVLNCNSTERALIEASFAAIQAQVWLICAATPPTLPPSPKPTEPPACNVEIAMQCILDFGLEIIAYYNNSRDLAVICAEMTIKEQCYLEISATCSGFTRWRLEAAWNMTRGLIAEKCIAFEKPKCEMIKARACILELWNTVDIAKDFQTACIMLNATLKCVWINIAGCSNEEIITINRSLEVVIGIIGGRCDDPIDIWPGDDKPIEICEGDSNFDLIYRLRHPPSRLCGSDADCHIYIDIDIDIDIDIKAPRCRDGTVIPQAAIEGRTDTVASPASDGIISREVTEINWTKNQTFSVAARLDFKYDGNQTRHMTVRMIKVISGEITERRSLANFTLKICDQDRPAICSAVNDPHITTFDGRYYNNFQEGFFVMYRHKHLPYEVQIVTQRCNSQASCNCAAGVRSGDTVFFVDSCRKKGFVSKHCGGHKYNCHNLMKVSLYTHTEITPGTRIFSNNNGKEFIVVLPHGTTVKIVVNGNYITVWITASPIDWKNTEGLCGFYDSKPINDFYLRDGTIYDGDDAQRGRQPLRFNNDWRVPDDQIIYTGVAENTFKPSIYCVRKVVRKPSGSISVTYCGYDGLLETCDWQQNGKEITSDPTYDNSPDSKGKKTGHSRRKRAAETKTALDDFDVDQGFVPEPITTASRAEATIKCEEYFNSTAVAKACISNNVSTVDNNLDSCVDDLLVTNDTAWMATALAAVQELCTQELTRNPKYQDKLAGEILAISCPNQCNQRGQCIQGACVCDVGFTGTDCGFNLNAAIELVLAVNDGLCDINTTNCKRVQLQGIGFIPNITTCTVTPVTVDENGVKVTGDPVKFGPSTFVSPSEVHCNLDTARSAIVQVSNNNSTFSNGTPPLFIVYDSRCYTCYSDQPNCTRDKLEKSCVIDGTCYGAGEQQENDSCLVCSPKKSTTKFSQSDACVEDKHVGLIVGLTIGMTAAAVLLAVLAAFCVVWIHGHYTGRAALTTSLNGVELQYNPPPCYDDANVSSTGYVNGVFVDFKAADKLEQK